MVIASCRSSFRFFIIFHNSGGCRMIWFILIVIALIIYLSKAYFVKHDTIIAYSGGLGSGKSLNSVITSKKLLNKNRFKVTLSNFFNKIKCFITKKQFVKKPTPLLYSSIPILIKKSMYKHRVKNITGYVLTRSGLEFYKTKFVSSLDYEYAKQLGYFSKKVLEDNLIQIDEKKYVKDFVEYSTELTDDHLLLQTKLVPKSVVFIDEIGSYCSQFEYNNPNAKETFDEFCRLFRHYTLGGYMVVNDQCSENIVLYVRRRLNTIFNLMNCRHFLCFYWVQCRNICISEEIKTVLNDNQNAEDGLRLIFGILPSKKTYDSYCYSARYDSVPESDSIYYERLKKHKLLKISPSTKLKKAKTK